MSPSFAANRQHAIVMGASIAGLVTARVLANHFAQVTIIEKDIVNRQPESRKGQPQTKHLHGLLPAGLNIICSYFPGIDKELMDNGGLVADFGDSMNWHAYGGFKKRHFLGINGISISRPQLEHLLRERVLALPNVELKDSAPVKQLAFSPGEQRVTSVVTENKTTGREEQVDADLVVDCTGRGTRTPQWLQEMGFGKVPVTEVKIDVVYATKIFKRDPNDPRSKTWIVSTPHAPMERRTGAVFAIEGNRWVVSVSGWHGDHPPLNDSGYLEFVKSLPNSNIYDIVSKCEPLTDTMQYKFPASTRRHYEKLSRFPTGCLVLGDAVSSFNPIYGQGMTSAMLQAVELDRLLYEQVSDPDLPKAYFKSTLKIINTIWQMATGEDFRFPETAGKRPPGIGLINKYISKIHKASITDEVVCGAFLKVIGLLQPPATLFYPKVLWRVFKSSK